MNFLELVQDLARDSGTLAGGVSLPTLAGATGRADKMKQWVAKAWLNIQNERSDWPWMRREFSSTLIVGQRRYLATDLGIAQRFGQWVGDRPDFRTFTIYDPDRGVTDEHEIRQIEFDTWRARYGRGFHDPNTPTEWAVSNLGEFCVGATPDKAYPLSGEYRRSPQMLTENADVPELPEQYHRAILWEAMKLLGIADESTATASSAITEYVLVRQNLDRDYLPEITIRGAPLA